MQRLGKAKAPAKAAKAKDVDEETLSELKEAFKIFDSKNTGTPRLIQVKSTPENSKPS